MWRKRVAMQHHLGFRNGRDETAYGCPITAQRRMCSSQHFVNVEPVGLPEGFFEKRPRNFEADVLHIGRRGEVEVGEFRYVEGKLCSDMAVRAFIVCDRSPELVRQLGNSTAVARLMAWEWPMESPR